MSITKRLSPDDWIAAGFRALAEIGPHALRAEPLARSLKTTKGSFYWHFADVPAFHAAMLTLWEDRAYADIVAALDDLPDPRQRLRALGHIASRPPPENMGGKNLETAIRAWGRADPNVAKAVARVDDRRETYLAAQLAQLGLSNPAFARIIYAAYIGGDDLSSRDGSDPAAALTTLIDLILALE
ncbi:MAG: AcrR family transcriptional regulator [Sulfitobacter sp.]|jgi:AcrR family transcriptional regulator